MYKVFHWNIMINPYMYHTSLHKSLRATHEPFSPSLHPYTISPYSCSKRMAREYVLHTCSHKIEIYGRYVAIENVTKRTIFMANKDSINATPKKKKRNKNKTNIDRNVRVQKEKSIRKETVLIRLALPKMPFRLCINEIGSCCVMSE